MRLDGSKILLTGASSGIGAALAPLLASRGATVGIVARREERMREIVERCRRHTPASRYWVADLADLDHAQRVALEADGAFGGLDALVNNAGIPKRVPVPRLTPALVEKTMRVNFFSPVRMTLAVLPGMLARGSGLVVNVSSMGGRLGINHEAAYCASKFAMCGWSEVTRLDLDGTGVQVKLILPGPIGTEIWDQPGNDPAQYDGPFTSATDAAAGIVAAMEGDGFEYYVPEVLEIGVSQKDVVVGKTGDVDSFLTGMAAMSASKD